MNSENYKRAKNLRNICEKEGKELLPLLLKYKNHCREFYELMRWTSLGCTEEQYEKLFDNFIYPYEEIGIGDVLETLINFVDKNERKEY